MALETGTYVNDLVTTNPVGTTDAKSEGDNHLKLIKSVLQATFPGMAGRAWRHQTKSANYTVIANDNMTVFNIATTGITLALTAAATLGNGHLFLVHANGYDVTIDPNSTEQINGANTVTVVNGQLALVGCNGTSFLALQMPLVGGPLNVAGAVTLQSTLSLGGDATFATGKKLILKASGFTIEHDDVSGFLKVKNNGTLVMDINGSTGAVRTISGTIGTLP